MGALLARTRRARAGARSASKPAGSRAPKSAKKRQSRTSVRSSARPRRRARHVPARRALRRGAATASAALRAGTATAVGDGRSDRRRALSVRLRRRAPRPPSGGAANSSFATRAMRVLSVDGSQSGSVGLPGTRAPASATPGVGGGDPRLGTPEVGGVCDVQNAELFRGRAHGQRNRCLRNRRRRASTVTRTHGSDRPSRPRARRARRGSGRRPSSRAR